MACTWVGRWRNRGARAAALLALGAAALLASCDPQPEDFCPSLSGLDKWVWDGEVSTSWSTAANWNHGGNSNVGVPGERNDPGDADDYVCVPPNKTAVLGDGESAHLQVLDNGGRLVVTVGAKLELKGAPASRTSYSHKLDLHGLLYGRGKLVTRPQGVLSWIHEASAPGAATMSTRETWNTATALPVPPDPGRTVISPGARLVVSGLGVNLVDRRIIDNQGTTEITGNGTYVAADWGTTFRNTGTFDFKADGDYVEGSVHGHAAALKGRFINTGQLRKTVGSGTSVLDARYSRTEGQAGPGTVRVQSGTLSILSDGTSATVVPGGSGATFATGGCPPLAACAQPATDSGNPQFATLTLPGGTADSAVTITEAADDGSKGRPIVLTVPSESATAANPMTLRIAVDGSVLQPADTHLTLLVQHDGVLVPDCTGAAQAQCVDRASSSTVAGDVVMVVRTAGNGRWRLR